MSTGQDFTGYNMFAYCGNNPVNYVDYNGHLPAVIEILMETIKKVVEELVLVVQTSIMFSQLQQMGFHNVTYASAKECTETLRNNDIDTAEEKAHFFAQCAAETNFGMWLTELGDDAYFNKNGYGRKYRGAGYIQLTWDFNYSDFANAMGDSNIYEIGADYVAANYAWSAAGWFWANNNINNRIANGASVRDITVIVRGGAGG